MGSSFRCRLQGDEGPGRTALPLGEFMRTLPLAALAVLAINDHLLKGAGVLPGWLTGKVSDVAGLLFFPLLVTATADTLAFGIARLTGARLDCSLRTWKLAVAVTATAAGFLALKLSPGCARLFVAALGALGIPAVVVPDPTDLLALPALLGAWMTGRAELRRTPSSAAAPSSDAAPNPPRRSPRPRPRSAI